MLAFLAGAAEDFSGTVSSCLPGSENRLRDRCRLRLRSLRYVSALPSTRGEAMSFASSVMLVVYPQACTVGTGRRTWPTFYSAPAEPEGVA